MKVLVLGKATERSESGEFGTPTSSRRWTSSTSSSSRRASCWRPTGSSRPARASGSPSTPTAAATVIDGPFAETKELVAGYSIWEVASMEEAVEWVKRAPFRDSEVELRKILDMDDFGDAFAAEITAAEERSRAEHRRQSS